MSAAASVGDREPHWIDMLPHGWEVKPLWAVVDCTISNVDKKVSEDEVPVRLCNYTDVYYNDFIMPSLNLKAATASKQEIELLGLSRDDVIITKDSESWEDIGVPALVVEAADNLVCGYHLALLRPRKDIIGAFLFRCLQARPVQVQFELAAKGVTRYGLAKSEVRKLTLPVPPRAMQRAIVDYLRRETERLDALVAAHERLLQLLAEKHRAMIACAVTRGIDPHIPMRDSGVPWLGEIPAHWSVERARWLFRERDQRSEDGPEELLTVSHLTGVTPRSEKDVNMFEADTLAGYKRCQPGDLVINTLWAWMGAMGVSFGEGVVSPAYNVYEPTDELDPAYVDALSRLPVFAQEAIRHSKGVWSSRLRLYPEGFFRMSLPLPPLSEQRQIVAALQSQRERLSRLETAATKAIELLKERRAALIAAAVTGSIEVPTTARDAERIDDHEDEGRDPPQRGTLSQDFWTSPTLDELAAAQGVGPLDTEALLGTWPGEDDDGFEDAIDELRHAGKRQDVE